MHFPLTLAHRHSVDLQEINLDKIQSWIEQGRLDPSRPITLFELCKSKVIGRVKDGIKLLARGSTDLKTPINIVVSRASQTAIKAVEAAGGTVTTRFYSEQAVERVRKGVMHPYISLRWDPVAIGNKALLPMEGAGIAPEERVTGLGYQFRLPDPASRKELEYYRDAKNRGYLSHLVAKGETASLFWKPVIPPEEIAKLKRSSKGTFEAKKREENTLW